MKPIFDELLANALLDWPGEIDVKILVKLGGDASRYSIKGLYEIYEKISSGGNASPEEIMLRNLHDAIYEVLHGAAAYIISIKMSELRPEAIRLRFERRLQNAVKNTELGYLPQDIQLINDYFLQMESYDSKSVAI